MLVFDLILRGFRIGGLITGIINKNRIDYLDGIATREAAYSLEEVDYDLIIDNERKDATVCRKLQGERDGRMRSRRED